MTVFHGKQMMLLHEIFVASFCPELFVDFITQKQNIILMRCRQTKNNKFVIIALYSQPPINRCSILFFAFILFLLFI